MRKMHGQTTLQWTIIFAVRPDGSIAALTTSHRDSLDKLVLQNVLKIYQVGVPDFNGLHILMLHVILFLKLAPC